MEYTKDTFNGFKNDRYSRVDATHPLDLFYGKDESGNDTLLFIIPFRPPFLPPTNAISVLNRWRGKDQKWTVSFSLKQKELESIFLRFCEDIIESSRHIPDMKKSVHFIAKRYFEWKQLLSNTNSQYLDNSSIKGLLGEMKFCLDFLISQVGIEKAMLSWQGPLKKDQDFVMDQIWYEIKTISPGREDVEISSIEQLDNSFNGYLVVQQADRTTQTDKNGITLNQAFLQLRECMKNFPELDREITGMLIGAGYISLPYYDQFKYVFGDRSFYYVSRKFPAIRRVNLPEAVTNARYMLSLAALAPFKREVGNTDE